MSEFLLYKFRGNYIEVGLRVNFWGVNYKDSSFWREVDKIV